MEILCRRLRHADQPDDQRQHRRQGHGQGHFVNPEGAWLNGLPEEATPLRGLPKASCDLGSDADNRSYLNCIGPDEFVKDVFLDSETDLMVLSFVPSLNPETHL